MIAGGSGCRGRAYAVHPLACGMPVSIIDRPIGGTPQNTGGPSTGSLGRGGALRFISAIQGYDLAGKSPPSCDVSLATTDANGKPIGGRMLHATDAGSLNVVPARTATLPPLNLKVGDRISLLASDHQTTVTLNIV